MKDNELNIPKYKINKDVLPNDYDSYSWQELNCLYRPMGIACNTFNNNNFNLFLLLVTFYHCYMIDSNFYDVRYTRNHPFYRYFNKDLKDVFNIEIKINEFKTEEEMHKKLITNINAGNIVLFPEDIYEIMYSPAYKQMNDTHYTLIKGYDINKELYYILDNIHDNAGQSILFSDFVLPFRDALRINKGYNKSFDNKNENYCFWAVVPKENIERINVIKTASDYLNNLLKDILNNKIKLDSAERRLISDFKNNIEIKEINEKLLTVNQRKVFYSTLVKFLNIINNSDERISKISQHITKSTRKWDGVKNKFLFRLQKDDRNVTDIEEEAQKILNEEYDMFRLIKEFLDDNRVEDNDLSKKYIIKNNYNAEYTIDNDSISVNHSQDKIYDTWTTKDNAWQLLIPVDSENIVFQVDVSSDTKSLSSFHFGIIIKSGDKKILFGNARNYEIAIYSPDDETNINWLEKTYYEKVCTLKIKFKDHMLSFYVKDKQKNSYELFYESKCERIDYVGLFSKTWDPIDSTTVFKNVLLNNEKVELI